MCAPRLQRQDGVDSNGKVDADEFAQLCAMLKDESSLLRETICVSNSEPSAFAVQIQQLQSTSISAEVGSCRTLSQSEYGFTANR